mgnify:CR=1 FL=1
MLEKQAQQSKPKSNIPKKTVLNYKEKREYEELIESIETTEQRLEQIDSEMVEASADYAKIKELNEEKEHLEQSYDVDITRWSELEEIKEQ